MDKEDLMPLSVSCNVPTIATLHFTIESVTRKISVSVKETLQGRIAYR
jgi:hypothetical protein